MMPVTEIVAYFSPHLSTISLPPIVLIKDKWNQTGQLYWQKIVVQGLTHLNNFQGFVVVLYVCRVLIQHVYQKLYLA